jgi:hypothetical protein
MREKVTTKIWKDTLHKLKLAAVLSQSTMLEVLDRLISQEVERLKKKEEADATGREASDQEN